MSYLVFNIVLFLLISLTVLSLYLTYKIEKSENEKQGLINARRRSLANAERQVLDRNRVIEYQENKIKKLKDKLTVLEAYITSNNYGNAELRLEKLKELVRDYQSQN